MLKKIILLDGGMGQELIKNSKSKQKREEALKRLKVVKSFLVD